MDCLGGSEKKSYDVDRMCALTALSSPVRYIWSNMLDLQRWAQGKEKCTASRSFAGSGTITRHFSASNFGAKKANQGR